MVAYLVDQEVYHVLLPRVRSPGEALMLQMAFIKIRKLQKGNDRTLFDELCKEHKATYKIYNFKLCLKISSNCTFVFMSYTFSYCTAHILTGTWKIILMIITNNIFKYFLLNYC